MKKILAICLLTTFIVACSPINDYDVEGNVMSKDMKFNIIRVGKCQYLYKVMESKEGYLFTHSGECNNPIHKQSKDTIK